MLTHTHTVRDTHSAPMHTTLLHPRHFITNCRSHQALAARLCLEHPFPLFACLHFPGQTVLVSPLAPPVTHGLLRMTRRPFCGCPWLSRPRSCRGLSLGPWTVRLGTSADWKAREKLLPSRPGCVRNAPVASSGGSSPGVLLCQLSAMLMEKPGQQ